MYFVNNYMKPYTWKEIRRVLEKELKKTRHIMTYGTIGSCNIEKDIDTIVTKKPGSKSEDFKQYKREDIFITLNDADRINSHVPSELINKRMQQLIVFLVEKKLGKNTNKFKNVKNPREIFYLICKEIDNC